MEPKPAQGAHIDPMTKHHSRNAFVDMNQFHYTQAQADESAGKPDLVEGLRFHRATHSARFPNVDELVGRLSNTALAKASRVYA
ncbi:hypothetical protein [Loktanella sp. Alg231-35]|uniref:hypothetical protein n=1 Tax=Loktanella sp. Alg231-35 TaxID=1922220 RepID=UPI001F38AF8D|nr:hypothetical protein [Loktanella sp. Alg231-35]